MPVITRSSARSVWERSEETSGGGLETSSLETFSISFRLSVRGSDVFVSLSSSALDRSHLGIVVASRCGGGSWSCEQSVACTIVKGRS